MNGYGEFVHKMTIRDKEFTYAVVRGSYQLGVVKVNQDGTREKICEPGWTTNDKAGLWAAVLKVKNDDGYNVAGFGFDHNTAAMELRREIIEHWAMVEIWSGMPADAWREVRLGIL